jgi:flagellar capping protein FliD
MSFNSATFNALSSSQIADAYSFLGNTASGPTAMQAQFTQLSDPFSGSIKAQQDQWDATDARITDQVTDLNTRIAAMQATLQSKLQVADTLLAGLQSTQNMLTSSIQSLNFASYGYQNTPAQSSSQSSS